MITAKGIEGERRRKRNAKKRRAARFLSLGLCERCGKESGGRRLCERHLAAKNRAQKARYLARHGGKLTYGKLSDAEKRKRENERRKAREQERRHLGLCARCDTPTKGTRLCGQHQGMKDKAWAINKRKEWTVQGMCAACGGVRETSHANCDSCRRRDREGRAAITAARRERGLCVCGDPLLPEGRICERCWYRHKAQRSVSIGRTRGMELKKLLESQGFCCAYSGKLLNVGSPDATIDHKTPRARGGTDDISNLQWVSRRVNQMKTDFTHDEFLAACRKIAEKWPKKQNQLRIA